MIDFLAHFSQNPAAALYLVQATIYAFAAALSRLAGHGEMYSCYTASSLIHGSLGICHIVHIG
jgi:hypothetical protein